MKILLVVPWFPSAKPNSIESRQGIFEYRQTVELTKRGHEFRVISVLWHGQLKFEKFSEKIHVYRVPSIITIKKIRYPLPDLIKINALIKKFVKEWETDIIVYSHMYYLTAFPVLWFNKIPSLVTTDGFAGVTWFYGNRFVDFAGYVYTHFIVKRMIKRASGIQLLSAKLLEQKILHEINCPNAFACGRGVDIDLFTPGKDRDITRSKLNLDQNDLVVLYVGRLDLVKGVEYLLDAAKIILPQYLNLKFILVGEGTLKSKFEENVVPFENNINFLGWRNDIPELMRMADVFVLPSLSEGAANVVMEASASGLPVISTNVGEVSQIIVDGETGILVETRDCISIANALKELINNPAKAKAMGNAGRIRIEQSYSWNTICKKLEKAYENLIDEFSYSDRK